MNVVAGIAVTLKKALNAGISRLRDANFA